MAKGGEFERWTCKKLSLWLSHGKRDDYLWRSSQSGGRATVRHRKGKKTAGHQSDIAATHKRGRRLTRFVSIECKTGYKGTSLYNLLDHTSGNDLMMQGFIKQAKEAQKRSGARYWAIIQRRKGRDVMIISVLNFFYSLGLMDSQLSTFRPGKEDDIVAVSKFLTFLKHADPNLLRRMK